MEIQKKAIELRKEKGRNYTRKELNIIAKAAGIKYFCRFNKHDLAEKLGIQLTEKKEAVFPSSRDLQFKCKIF